MKADPSSHKGFAQTEILASLPFQVLLFFNFNYSAAYGVALIYLTYIKCTTWAVHDLPRVMHFFFLSLWCCGEVMRLYFGYYGNLQEKVPHLAAFVLLTVFPAIPSTVYFASLQPLLRPFDQISSIFMLAGLVVELYLGVGLARRLIAHQTARFFRECQEDSSTEVAGDEEDVETETEDIILEEFLKQSTLF